MARAKSKTAMAPYVSREEQEERRTYGSTSPKGWFDGLFAWDWSSPKTWAIVGAVILVIIIIIYMMMHRGAAAAPPPVFSEYNV
jgi:hypothetical protein